MTKIQNEQSSTVAAVLSFIRAIRKADKENLNAACNEYFGGNWTPVHMLFFLLLVDRARPTGLTRPTEANFVIEQPYTCDFMGEWIDRQATTARKILRDLRALGWIETSLDVEGYRGFKQIDLFTVRALIFIKSLGVADTKKIKETRRSKSQKRKRDTRKRARVECLLPDGWLKFAKSRHDANTNLKDWIGCLEKLHENGYDLAQMEAHALEERDTQMDAYDFVQSITDKLGDQVQRVSQSKAFAAEVIFGASIESMKKARNAKQQTE